MEMTACTQLNDGTLRVEITDPDTKDVLFLDVSSTSVKLLSHGLLEKKREFVNGIEFDRVQRLQPAAA